MRRLPISAVVLTTVTAVLLGLPAELAAADRGSAGRDRAALHAIMAVPPATPRGTMPMPRAMPPVPPATPRGTMPMPRAMPPVPPAMPRGTVLATPAIMPMPRPMPRGTVLATPAIMPMPPAMPRGTVPVPAATSPMPPARMSRGIRLALRATLLAPRRITPTPTRACSSVRTGTGRTRALELGSKTCKDRGRPPAHSNPTVRCRCRLR